jgi:hypothetical protein
LAEKNRPAKVNRDRKRLCIVVDKCSRFHGNESNEEACCKLGLPPGCELVGTSIHADGLEDGEIAIKIRHPKLPRVEGDTIPRMTLDELRKMITPARIYDAACDHKPQRVASGTEIKTMLQAPAAQWIEFDNTLARRIIDGKTEAVAFPGVGSTAHRASKLTIPIQGQEPITVDKNELSICFDDLSVEAKNRAIDDYLSRPLCIAAKLCAKWGHVWTNPLACETPPSRCCSRCRAVEELWGGEWRSRVDGPITLHAKMLSYDVTLPDELGAPLAAEEQKAFVDAVRTDLGVPAEIFHGRPKSEGNDLMAFFGKSAHDKGGG